MLHVLCCTVLTKTFPLSLLMIEETAGDVKYGPLYPGALQQFSRYRDSDAFQI